MKDQWFELQTVLFALDPFVTYVEYVGKSRVEAPIWDAVVAVYHGGTAWSVTQASTRVGKGINYRLEGNEIYVPYKWRKEVTRFLRVPGSTTRPPLKGREVMSEDKTPVRPWYTSAPINTPTARRMRNTIRVQFNKIGTINGV